VGLALEGEATEEPEGNQGQDERPEGPELVLDFTLEAVGVTAHKRQIIE
jgi:hypothetical protein